MALFGQKFGELMRVVEVPQWSTELRGGTHARNTGQILMLRVVSDNGLRAGVRQVAVRGGGLGSCDTKRRSPRTIA
jgi:alanyl-tRNA synthetase